MKDGWSPLRWNRPLNGCDWEEFSCQMCDGAWILLNHEEDPGVDEATVTDSGSVPGCVAGGIRGGTAADAVDDGHHLRHRRLDRGHSGQHPGSLVFAQ